MVVGTQSRFPIVGENGIAHINSSTPDLNQLLEENPKLKEKLERKDEDILGDLLRDLERKRNERKALEAQLADVKEKYEDLRKEQESAIEIYAEERERRDIEENALRKKLKEATATIQELVDRVKQLKLEKIKTHKRNAT